eukprot:m.4920 g.4920  ORF g.4920 m.4920 type:complete len:223 (+) comp11617_c0_seq2:20-688(+)
MSRRKPVSRSVIDSTNPGSTPLDFSFKELCQITDLVEEEPRSAPLPRSTTTVTVGPKREGEGEGAGSGQPVGPGEGSEQQTMIVKKYKTSALRLNNNSLTEISGFLEITSKLVCEPKALSWIDLSFNRLKTIDPILIQFSELTVLYLHGNEISKLTEVDKMSHLAKLKSLTLHGNPIETGNRETYKQYVLSIVLQLRTFDFSGVTKSDRAMATRKIGKTAKT